MARAEETNAPLPTSDEIQKVLWQNILPAWYPRSLDLEYGGFHENFAHDWTRKRTRAKCLVYQARMTWTPANILLHHQCDRQQQRVYCGHGLEFLRRGMWDWKHGGFYDQVAPPGGPDPTVQPVKQLYSTSFGIYAAATGYRATNDPNARQLAQDAFVWLDEHAHDPDFGGYHEHLDRTGKPLSLTPTDEDYRDKFMVIGKFGRKSMNAHIHILEALTALRHMWDSPVVTQRLEETFLIVRDKIVMPGGHLNMFADRDFTPIDEASSFGHELEIAYLLAEADELLHGHVSDKTAQTAKRLVDHSLKWGWDSERGGFYYEGPPTGPPDKRNKSWWVLPEAMNGLLTVARLFPDDRAPPTTASSPSPGSSSSTTNSTTNTAAATPTSTSKTNSTHPSKTKPTAGRPPTTPPAASSTQATRSLALQSRDSRHLVLPVGCVLTRQLPPQ